MPGDMRRSSLGGSCRTGFACLAIEISVASQQLASRPTVQLRPLSNFHQNGLGTDIAVPRNMEGRACEGGLADSNSANRQEIPLLSEKSYSFLHFQCDFGKTMWYFIPSGVT
jgi:hypothetical protein